VARRLLDGERPADLAREFGISKAAMSERYSAQVRAVRAVAHRLMEADEALRALAPLEQLAALRLADDLRIKAAADNTVVRTLLGRFHAG
jgi:hypothetical protein